MAFEKVSLYVGDLDINVTETDLHYVFSSVAPVSSIRICRCSNTGNSLCYGYVNFFTNHQASRALQVLNHTNLNGKPMRLMWSQRNPGARKTGVGNLFVKNLDASIDSTSLETIFSRFGTILSCKVAEEHGKSKGFGFVQFDSEDSALAARTALHDTMLEGKKLYVSKFVRKSERTEATPRVEPNYTNLFVKYQDPNMTKDSLHSMFSAFGKVSSVVIMKDNDGKSRGFGFVNFEFAEDAKKAVSSLNGSQHGSQTLYVAKAKNQAKRRQFPQNGQGNLSTLKESNLYVKNLEKCVDDNILREIFSPWGSIVSAKVMRHDDGVSKGFGFVCFSNPEEARSAQINLHGFTYENKRLYVAIAQSKKERQLELQKHFAESQFQSVRPSQHDVLPHRLVYQDFSPRLQPVPYFRNPISSLNFGAKMGDKYPPVAHSFHQYFPTTVKYGKCNLQDWDISQGFAGMQPFGPVRQWYQPAATELRGEYPAQLLARTLAKCSNNSTKVYQNLQPEHKESTDETAQVVTEANSMKSSSSSELA